MRDDILKLKEYMEDHCGRLDMDIENAKTNTTIEAPNYYEGAKGATTLFIGLLTDIIKKHESK